MRVLLSACVAVGVAVSAALAAPPAAAEEVTVFAAASLKNALDDIAAEWRAVSEDTLTISYAGSSQLARQIEQGAPADIFISANVDWMDRLEEAGLVDPATRRDLLSNSIVLVAHGRDAAPVEIAAGLDLPGLLGDGRLAMAMVDAVPAGIYGKAALESLGIWPSVEAQVAQADNVRAALALVSRGEAPYGIVYATDAVADDNVTVVGTFPADSHPPIVYPVALTVEAGLPAAQEFLLHLGTDTARELFERQGFVMLD